jgi:hypothetical protein
MSRRGFMKERIIIRLGFLGEGSHGFGNLLERV